MITSDERPATAPPAPTITLDAYSPEQIAERVERQGVYKSRLPPFTMTMLAIVGGGFIGLGAMFQIAVLADPDLNAGWSRMIGGVAFATGYLIAMTAGAEVFTSNNLTVMSWAARKLSTMRLLQSWLVVLLGNAVGAGGLALVIVLSGHMAMHEGAVGRVAVQIAAAKGSESFLYAFFGGIIGNLLICVAVWIAMAGRSVTDKFFAPLLPIAALSIGGFEHCVGNIYYMCSGLLTVAVQPGLYPDGSALDTWRAMHNLFAVTCGNIFGGGVMVALVYHVIYRRLVEQWSDPS